MKGLTLIEMIIALSIVVIVSLIAIPSFHQRSIQVSNSIAQAQLLQELQQAQQIANSKMISIAVCLSNDGKSCAAVGSMALSFADSHADGVLHDEGQLISSVYLKGDGAVHLRSYPIYRNYILIAPTIISKSDNGTFWSCSADHIAQWEVTVSQYGEPRVISNPVEKLDC